MTANKTFIMPFGKYQGMSANDIVYLDREYAKWVVANNGSRTNLVKTFKLLLDTSAEQFHHMFQIPGAISAYVKYVGCGISVDYLLKEVNTWLVANGKKEIKAI